jgi:hypothetical protein
MAVVTVETAVGPVRIDEQNIEAWSGKPASEFKIVSGEQPKPKPKKSVKAVVEIIEPANVVQREDGTFILVDKDDKQIGGLFYETEEDAWSAALG